MFLKVFIRTAQKFTRKEFNMHLKKKAEQNKIPLSRGSNLKRN
jgi:hypothetical protein